MVKQWVKDLVEETFGKSPLEIGKCYIHPEYGKIKITSGQYWGQYGLSNFWNWIVLDTNEKKQGYGGNWEECDA